MSKTLNLGTCAVCFIFLATAQAPADAGAANKAAQAPADNAREPGKAKAKAIFLGRQRLRAAVRQYIESANKLWHAPDSVSTD